MIKQNREITELLNELIRLERADALLEVNGSHSDKLYSRWHLEMVRLSLLEEIEQTIRDSTDENENENEDEDWV